ncbi:hypothetical protein SERLADRAFT_390533, partial [Serpula lacrymans var. lacrymans S7.9]
MGEVVDMLVSKMVYRVRERRTLDKHGTQLAEMTFGELSVICLGVRTEILPP